jgi:nitrate reductase gamma subunit
MFAVLGGCVVILTVIGLGFYTVRRIRPDSLRSLRVRTTILRMFSFSMEIESSGTLKTPRRDNRIGDESV